MKNKMDAFEHFILHTWINHQKFRGIPRICAFFLNILWGIIKFFLCIAILLFLWPHIAVSSLNAKKPLNILQKILLPICLIICVPLDLLLLLLFVFSTIGAIQLITLWTLQSFIAAFLLALMSYGLLRILIVLFCSLIGTNEPATEKTTTDNDSSPIRDAPCESHERSEIDTTVDCTPNDINNLWKQGSEKDWHNALTYYYTKISNESRKLDSYLESIHEEDVMSMSADEFYNFLHDKYYVWKYKGSYLSRRQRDLQKYIIEDNLSELYEIKQNIFSTNRNDIDACLQVVTRINGLGIAGASGLLSILFPKDFGTVDKFLIISLSKISDWEHESKIAGIHPDNAISRKNGVLLIDILRKKATELNEIFSTDFWTPRKIDMVLWAIGR